MITIEIKKRPGKRWDKRGLLFDATAEHEGLRHELTGVRQPVVAALRRVINTTPGFTDCPWRLVRDGRIDLFGPSARKMAALRFEEGDRSIRARPDKPGLRAFFAPSPVSAGEGTR